MPVEIERKFLVAGESWRETAGDGIAIVQGFVARGGQAAVRVRLMDGRAFLTVKSTAPGLARAEYEYEIPAAHAEAMLRDLCGAALIEKKRFSVTHGAHMWTVDVFAGALEGLVMAEVELAHANERISVPNWAGREVTDDPAFRNDALAARAYAAAS